MQLEIIIEHVLEIFRGYLACEIKFDITLSVIIYSFANLHSSVNSCLSTWLSGYKVKLEIMCMGMLQSIYRGICISSN